MSAAYAICTKCPAEFADKEEANTHGTETLEAAKIANPDWVGSISGHGYRVINPTPEEVHQRRIDSRVESAVEDAINDAIYELDRVVDRGEMTAEEVRASLRRYDGFIDAWDEYAEAIG